MPQFSVWSLADFGATSLNDLFTGNFTLSGSPDLATISDDDTSFDDFFGTGGQTQDPGMNQILTGDLVLDGATVATAGDGIYNAAEGLITNHTTGQTGRLIYVTVNGGTVNEFVGVTSTIALHPDDEVTTSSLSPLASENYANIVACFTRGTHIRTPTGLRRIETLKIGDLVLTRDHGPQPLRWIGRRFFTRGLLEANPHLRPIRIAAKAFGPERPLRDLLVSPQHRLLIGNPVLGLLFGLDEALIAAKCLLGRRGICALLPDDGVEYIHLMFDHHELLDSNGLESESFHPAILSQGGAEDALREELFSLFPGIQDDPGSYGPTVRTVLKPREARLLELQ